MTECKYSVSFFITYLIRFNIFFAILMIASWGCILLHSSLKLYANDGSMREAIHADSTILLLKNRLDRGVIFPTFSLSPEDFVVDTRPTKDQY